MNLLMYLVFLFSDYLQSQFDEIRHNISSPDYMFFFLAISIKIYRKLTGLDKRK